MVRFWLLIWVFVAGVCACGAVEVRGEYASESEVIRDGLRALFARDAAVEQWLRTEVVEAYDELRANPDQAITSAELRKQLKEAREQKMADGVLAG